MEQAKKGGSNVYGSMSPFFMINCTCSKLPNGFYHWDCSPRTCKECKDTKPVQLKCQTSKEIVSVDQFQTIEKNT